MTPSKYIEERVRFEKETHNLTLFTDNEIKQMETRAYVYAILEYLDRLHEEREKK